MALVKAVMMMELAGVFAGSNPDPMTPGKKIAKAFKNYLKMGMNAGGFPTSNVVDAAAGLGIGGVFAQQLPTMALTYMSGQQIGPPIAPPTHMPGLMKLFSGPMPTGMNFAKELADVLDTWTKTWVVAGLIPGAPPIPFAGPLS